MKKAIISLIVVLTLCVGIFALTACGETGSKGGPGNTPGGSTGGNATVGKTTETVGFSVASTASVLGTMTSTAPASAAAHETIDNPGFSIEINGNFTPGPGTNALLEKIDSQIRIIENFIGSNPVNVTEEASDRAEYSHKLNISTKNMAGDETVYVLYYNVTPVTETPDPDDDDDDEADIDDEQEFILTGIIVMGEETYTVTGEMETEEGEREFSMTAKLTEDTYILFEQEIEAEGGETESEFTYTMFVGGQKVTSFSLEVETDEKGEQEIEFSNKDILSGFSVRYAKETETNGDYAIKADVRVGLIRASVKIKGIKDKDTGIYSYKYIISADGWADIELPQPEQPVTPDPEQPVTPEPEQPVTPEPEQPVTPEPEQPVTPEPEQPVTPEPEQPVTA